MRMNILVSIVLLVSAASFLGCDSDDDSGSSSQLNPVADASTDAGDTGTSDGASVDAASGADGGSGPAADGASQGDTSVGPEGDGRSGGDAWGEQPAEQCLDQADQDAMAEYPHEALYKWMLTQVQGCFYGLGGSVENPEIPEDEFEVCITDLAEEGLGVSGECASCFSDIGICSKNFCTNPCGSVEISEGMNLQACLDCQKENYCAHAFDTCIGWALTENLTLPFN